MTKHSLSGIQSLNNFVFTESGEIIAWRAYNVGPGKVFAAASLARLGTPQGPTNLQVHQAFSSPNILIGVFRAPSSTREQQPTVPPMEPIAAEGIHLEEEESVVFGCPGEGCIKVYQSHSSLQRHLDAGKHLLALKRERVHVRRDKEKVGRDVQVNFWKLHGSSSSAHICIHLSFPWLVGRRTANS